MGSAGGHLEGVRFQLLEAGALVGIGDGVKHGELAGAEFVLRGEHDAAVRAKSLHAPGKAGDGARAAEEGAVLAAGQVDVEDHERRGEWVDS